MPSTFIARPRYTCSKCHHQGEALVHFYAETWEVLVFGLCEQCGSPLSDLIRDVEEMTRGQVEQVTFHYAQLDGQAWYLDCDTPTSIKLDAMHAPTRNVHPSIWAAMAD